MADGLKTITRRGEIGTSFPVFGLRPMRCPFLRTTNEPNDESFTVSPRSRQSVITFSTISTRVADSVRDSPTFWYTASHRSARVTVLPAIALTPLSATNLINLIINDIHMSRQGSTGLQRNSPARLTSAPVRPP